ncbi:protein-glutamate methylesterase/protein-glutamine glutaminase [Paracoccus methylarcula]|uniref:Protein-glutamate methylesterase/protein-glutamine glutaminase n=1 Tax=Paracoccus methylarcula TaxID=72022 RepID=A0A3R7NA94_9RHOB|nr:chemotaxis response regulator protein-glutamate methylesterase [Paracoccus methylarcula]RNF33202.1 chemotaxis response regulator protein-glutamate methylesterase [Paracoccus methylarcula]
MSDTAHRPIRVLIVDDSAVVRQTMAELIGSDPGLEVMGTAADPFAAAASIARQRPDVITLDVEMPRMDGVTFLRKLMAQHPIPVVMCSSLVGANTETLQQALSAGAVEVICKPQMGVKGFLEDSRTVLCDAIKAAAQARLSRMRPAPVQAKLSADAVLSPPSSSAMVKTTETIIAIGVSTGRTEAVRSVLEAMPANCPPIVVVQHMPEHFTAAFARRLDGLCGISVSEARHGDRMLRGHALIAPGNRHTLLTRSGATYCVELRDGPLVSRHRPSVDVLFRSVARAAGRNAVGLIMTGMGDDGARGLLEMRQAGARTLGQDEASCVVYGMPNEARKLGAVEEELPLSRWRRCCCARRASEGRMRPRCGKG